MIFKGRFVTLRPLTVEDAEMTLRWRRGRRARFLQPGSQTIQEQREWIASKEQSSDLNFVIEHCGEPVGMIALLELNCRHRTAEMGRFLIGEQAKVGNAPVAFEAELLLSDYVFDDLDFHKIYGDIMEDNIAMIRTRLYLGYQKDGILRDHYIYDGVYKNTVAISLLKDEYRMVCRPKLVQLIAFFCSIA
jgi:diamine N-acetyltransferase